MSRAPNNPEDHRLEQLRVICSRFPEAEEGALQDRVLFHVRRRRFAILNSESSPYRKRWADCGSSIHFATDTDQLKLLDQDSRFSPSPHHGFRGWRMLPLDKQTDWQEIDHLLEQAYRSVAGKELVGELDA